MVLQDSYITDAGMDLLDRATAGKGTIVWGQAATSSLDSDDYTDAEMREIDTLSFGTITSLGAVTNSLVNIIDKTVSIQCETNNETYNGYARTFGVWARLEEDDEDVLAFVARCGDGATPVYINANALGLVKSFFEVAIHMSDTQAEFVAAAEGYYATATALEETNDIVEDLSLHTPRLYRDVWEAIALSREGDRFGFLQDEDEPITLTTIDGDTLSSTFEVQGCYDGLLFCWYVAEGESVAHSVIFSVDQLRKGSTTSLFNTTSIIGGDYMAGGVLAPVYVDDNLILFADPNATSYVHAVSRDGDAFEYIGVITLSWYEPPEVTDICADDLGGDGPSLVCMYMTNAGSVMRFVNGMMDKWAYIVGIHCARTGSNVLMDTYKKGIKSDTDYIDHIGECNGLYWGADYSNVYLENSGEFYQVYDTSSMSISVEFIPRHYNTMLFTDSGGVYSMIDISSTPKARKIYDTGQSISGSSAGTSQGLVSLYDDYGVSQFGVFPNPHTGGSEFYAGGIGMTYTFGRSGGDVTVTLHPVTGDYSRCIRKHGQIFPLL